MHLALHDAQLAAGAALASHLVFANAEPLPNVIFALYTCGSAAGVYYYHFVRHVTVGGSIVSVAALATIYTATLCASIGIYRLYFHRLRKFPGTPGAALSKWSLVPTDVAGQRPYFIDEQHKKFGDIVRTGPRELSINDPAAIPVVFGASSPAMKGNWYVAVHAGLPKRSLSLHATVDPHDHAARRRIWDQGFKTSSLKGYESMLSRFTTELMLRLESFVGKEIKIDEWVAFLSYDMMSTIGFSHNPDLIQKGELNRPIRLLEKAMEMFNVLGGVSYMAHVARLLPNPVAEWEDYCREALDERINRGTNEPDIMSYLLGEDKETGWKHTREELISDVALIIVAGSDTTSASMAMAMFYLTQHPEILAKVAKEMDDTFGSEPANDFDKLAKAPYLNGVINETLRCTPPVMSGLQRVTPPEGMVISGKHIPGNVTITIPTYSLHRDARNFSRPTEFIPERWYDAKSAGIENHNAKAFNPFSFGPTGCVGRQLAMMEMRSVIASFAQLFNSKFASEFNPDGWPERNLMDTFTLLKKEPIRVVLSPRPDRLRKGA